MSDDNANELIEATIRRVQEAKAARQAMARRSPDVASEADAPDPRPERTTSPEDRADEAESAIEATIRRVAAAKAAQEEAANTASAEASAGEAGEAGATDSVVGDAIPAIDAGVEAESAIEATIRRVAAAKAAQLAAVDEPDEVAPAASLAPEPGGHDDGGPGDAPAEEPPIAVRATASASRLKRDAVDEVAAEPWRDGLATLEAELARVRGEVARLAARLDDYEQARARVSIVEPVSRTDDEDDGWDDSPQISRLPSAAPPRPAIFRDPSPTTATAELLVDPQQDETVIDTRPIPKPLPALTVERSGLDLLPRTYRVTVEDKRRGVDLVPLHRALLGIEGARDMSLLSYSNGVAIVSLETVDPIDPETLGEVVGRAMSRAAKVEVHNEQTMVVKLAEE